MNKVGPVNPMNLTTARKGDNKNKHDKIVGLWNIMVTVVIMK